MKTATLTPAHKYNWWTSTDKKGAISPTQQMASIMSCGTLQEIMTLFRDPTISRHDLQESFLRIEKDMYALTPRRKAFLVALLDLKNNNRF